MADQRIDPAIYGGTPAQLRPELAAGGTSYQAPTPVPGEQAVQGSSLLQQGQAAVLANRQPEPGVLASVDAAMSQWSLVHLLDWMSAPTFKWADGHNPAEMLKQVEFPLSLDEREFLTRTKSPDEFTHKLEAIREQRDAYDTMGAHGVAAFATGAFDPGYLALDALSMGAGRLVRAGVAARAVAGGVAAAGAVGIGAVESELQPTSAKQIFMNAMLNGAATAAVFRNGHMERAEPELADTLNAIRHEAEGVTAPLSESHPDFVGPVQTYRSPFIDKGGPSASRPAVGDNLTRPAFAAEAEGNVKVQYGRGNPRDAAAVEAAPEAGNVEYNPALSLSREEQAAVNADGRVTQVRSVSDISQHSRNVENGRTRIDPDAKAVYLPDEDRVFLVTDNIKPHDDVKGILLHEVGVHMNAERVLGTERLGKMLDRLEELAAQGNARARQAFRDVPEETPLHLQREEALGYYIERNHKDFKDGFVQRFVHGVRETLRRVGLKGLKLSENDIVQLIRKSAKTKHAGSFDAAFPYVWHGGPTRGIESMDTAFIGSGEGNTAYGWGHYLTSEKGTALDYRNKESVRRGIDPEEGGLYRLKINAKEHQFIDLDGRTQSATVQAALDKLGVNKGVTGKTAYDYLTRKLGSQKAASEALWAEGVAGNKYATGRTRYADTKNSNYVVFHNDAVDTVARYSKPTNGPMAPAAAKATVAQRVGKSLEWSLSKTMGRYSDKAKAITRVLVDDPLDMTADSVVSQHRAVRADLEGGLRQYESLLADELAKQGAGLLQRITSPVKSFQKQRAIQREVGLEMLRRERAALDGMPLSHAGIPAHVKAMADALGGVAKVARSELERSGVFGAENLPNNEGYFTRRWDISSIEATEQAMVAHGMTLDAARDSIRDSLSVGIQRANGWDAQLASDVAKAILDRARSKGYFEDSAFRRGIGEDGMAEVRNILTGSGITGQRMQRVLDVLEGKADEAGKASVLKHRVDVAMDEPIVMPNGESKTLADLIDMDLSRLTDRYLDTVATQAAFARKGLTKTSDIAALRKEYLESIPSQAEREEAVQLFDNTIASMRGDPVGEKLPAFMRKMQAVTQMVGLARAGMFQFTEYATAMAQFGAARTVGYMLREAPIVRTILGDSREASHLSKVLAMNASSDFRIRPFMTRLEDNFEVPISDAMQLSLMQAKQLVPYFNALKFVQGHQSRVVGNLITNTFERAASGDQKALAALEHYGLESRIMAQIQGDISAHGMDTAKWSDATWDAVRGPLNKMVDDAVLRNRTGEIPAFAQFTSTGKFMFTFRSFVLGAHNKVLAGSLHRDGFSGLGLIMLYQFPLTYLATASANAMAGKKAKDEKAALGEAFSQMGSLGLLSEAVGVAFQNKQQFGSPGTIAIDRVYKLGAAAAQGNANSAASTATSMVPLLSVILPVKAIGENLKEHK